MNGLNRSDREARTRMERAEGEYRRKRESAEAGAGDGTSARLPRRYKLYDRIKGRVSVTTMNVIICATVLLLIIALVYGIATGTPLQ